MSLKSLLERTTSTSMGTSMQGHDVQADEPRHHRHLSKLQQQQRDHRLTGISPDDSTGEHPDRMEINAPIRPYTGYLNKKDLYHGVVHPGLEHVWERRPPGRKVRNDEFEDYDDTEPVSQGFSCIIDPCIATRKTWVPTHHNGVELQEQQDTKWTKEQAHISFDGIGVETRKELDIPKLPNRQGKMTELVYDPGVRRLGAGGEGYAVYTLGVDPISPVPFLQSRYKKTPEEKLVEQHEGFVPELDRDAASIRVAEGWKVDNEMKFRENEEFLKHIFPQTWEPRYGKSRGAWRRSLCIAHHASASAWCLVPGTWCLVPGPHVSCAG